MSTFELSNHNTKEYKLHKPQSFLFYLMLEYVCTHSLKYSFSHQNLCQSLLSVSVYLSCVFVSLSLLMDNAKNINYRKLSFSSIHSYIFQQYNGCVIAYGYKRVDIKATYQIQNTV